MLTNLTEAQKQEFTKVITSLGQSLDITETQYNALVKSYEAVGKWLQGDPVLSVYNPIVTPQGSLRLGTIIQPISPDDDMDVDLVFRLSGKSYSWTQKSIKDLVGKRLKANGTYNGMLDTTEGKRCWTLKYRQDSDNLKERYHMDILPCVANSQYETEYRSLANTAFDINQMNKIAIRITDKTHPLYSSSIDIDEWLKSNPDGYALWFASRCTHSKDKVLLAESIVPINKYTKEKSTLQRIVQILKRHRDIKFYNKDDKPISIIITTLAAKAYKGETSILEGLANVVSTMENYIEKDELGNDAVYNPLDNTENFADKWIKSPAKRRNFYDWLACAKSDIATILSSKGVTVWENIGKNFGKSLSEAARTNYTSGIKSGIKDGSLRIGTAGVLSSVGKSVNAANTFYGKE
ncbi:MAG: nucleotidyltransferase [Veillonella sp.]|nr:nucleotidyltransferase [Veillonella sp.]